MAGRQKQSRATQHDIVTGQTLHQGTYTIEAVLGQGGMGRVYLASHITNKTPLALKQGRLDQPIPESVTTELDHALRGKTRNPTRQEDDFPASGGTHTDRFIREALLLERLHHPSIPSLYDYFVEDGYWYLAMDYIPGPTLSSYLHQNAPLSPLEALNYAMQLCDVLEYLHKQTPPVVFRDMKPSNVILAQDGRVMLIDFGIARYFKPHQINDTTELGSWGYAPPEQYQGEGQTDARSDLYSLGIILHEMLTGSLPDEAGESSDSVHALNPALSSIVSGLISVAIRSDAAYRFQSAHTFYLALERAYGIEERRAYQKNNQFRANDSDHVENKQAAQQRIAFDIPAIPKKRERPSSSRHIDRIETKAIRREVQHNYQEKEQVETRQSSIDEQIQQIQQSPARSVTPLSFPTMDDEEDMPVSPSSRPPRSRHIGRTLFILALVLCVVIASVLVSMHYVALLTSATGQKTQTDTPSPSAPTAAIPSTVSTASITNTPTPDITSSWQLLPSLPSPEADNTAIYVRLQGQNYIYMSGGYRGPHVVPHYDHGLYRYNIASAQWEKLADTTIPGMVNNVAAQDEQHHIFFTGGYSPTTGMVSSLLYMYQPSDGTIQKIVPPVSIPVGFGAAMIADQQGHLYLTEGFTRAGNPRITAGTGWYRYDIASGVWHSLASLPAQLGYALLAPDSNGGILLLGGSMDVGQGLATTHIYRYNIAQNTWMSEQVTSPVALSGATSCLNGSDQLIVIGGYDAAHDQSYNSAWLFNLHTLTWKSLAPLPSGGSLLGSATCDGAGHVYLVRGANDPSRPTSDFEELTI